MSNSSISTSHDRTNSNIKYTSYKWFQNMHVTKTNSMYIKSYSNPTILYYIVSTLYQTSKTGQKSLENNPHETPFDYLHTLPLLFPITPFDFTRTSHHYKHAKQPTKVKVTPLLPPNEPAAPYIPIQLQSYKYSNSHSTYIPSNISKNTSFSLLGHE